MQNLTKASFLALMIAATPLWAQETATEETPTEETTTEQGATEAPAGEAPAAEEAEAAGEGASQTPSPDDGLAMGTPEGEEEQPAGGLFTKETHGDWQLRCVPANGDQPEQCQLYQLLNDQNDNPVAEMNLFALPPGGQAIAGANIVTPLETLLTEQITLSVDGSQGKRYPYTFCTQIGCISRIGMTAADVNGFKAGNAATLTLVPAGAPDQKVRLKVSLTGFTAGFTALQAALPAAN
ncbi:invasion associated locus B family protein [Oceanicola sp. 502str15]|uniref:invasion associated locus B family protein n=1 Tax=Oceanicola sp. 502str15 TaxID=2696061 RepID=UPI00209586D8|nr:invasion associated locus B family protein [Oceanicola sp. 502str15]MCO6381969.1 invasion associated locus B family protein [Oceanicola sp. 502str15]